MLKKYLIISVALILATLGLHSQPNVKVGADNDMIPLNNKIKSGTLSNGMKYFILQNSKPEKRMEIRLALAAGSINEDDDQQGLAHFVEHMCFNGTKNFPKNDLINFLQKTGVRFGAHLNAYTSFDETVYMLLLPTDDKEVMKKGFQVFEDWASAVTFEDEEVDKERGVILEEQRLRNSAQLRVMQKHAPIAFGGTKYADRFPIGDTNILKTFPYSTIKKFYSDWYRPDLMSIIAVGDFNVDEIEAMIKDGFSDIKNPANPRKHNKIKMPVDNGLNVSIEQDKELTFPLLSIAFQNPEPKRGTYGEYKQVLIDGLVASMINQRLAEKAQTANPPYLQAQVNFSGGLGSRYDFDLFAANKTDDFMGGFDALLSTVFAAKQNGFTQSEFEREKVNILSSYEQSYNEREKTESAPLAMELVRHTLNGESAPGIEAEYFIVKQLIDKITIADINNNMNKYIRDNNITITVSAPPSMKTPSKDEIIAAYKKSANTKHAAYQDLTSNKPLFDKDVKSGTIKNETTIKELDVTTYTLSNGAKVIVKPTTFKDDQIMMNAYSWGGLSLVSDEDYHNANECDGIVSTCGVNGHNSIGLQKLLAGKNLGLYPNISSTSEGLNGSSTPKDLETFMQLLHLHFTDPNDDKESFESYIAKMKEATVNQKRNPSSALYDTINYYMSGYHKRGAPTTAETYDKINYEKAMKIYKERYANAGDFTFIFVGNINLDEFKPLMNKYIGSLPSNGAKEKYKNLGLKPPKGADVKKVYKGTEQKSQVQIRFMGDFAYNLENWHLGESLAEYMSNRLREQLREEKGGVYGVGVNFSPSKHPEEKYQLMIQFGCNPDRVEELIGDVMMICDEVKAKLADADNMQKIKETQKREHEVELKENRNWMSWLYLSDASGIDVLAATSQYPKLVEKLTAEDIKKTANKYLDKSNMKQFILYPEKNN